jgi:hypothetical protein
MTKNNSNKQNLKMNQLNPFGGTMVVTNNPARRRIMKQSKWFISPSADIANSEQALSTSATPYEVGSQLTNHADDTTVAELGTDAINWVQRFDSYTVEEVEYIISLVSSDQSGNQRILPVTVWSFEDRDSPREVGANWSQTRDRQNLARVVLRANNPSLTIAKIRPVPLFDGAVTDNSPSNIVPENAKWVDSLAIKQRFNGLRVFSACPTKDSSGQTYRYTLYLEKRVKVCGRSAL